MKSKNLTYLMTHPLILTWFMFLGWFMMLLLWRQAQTRYRQISSQAITPQSSQYHIWDYAQYEWVVKWQYWFWLLQFMSNDHEQFILKSTITNITHLTGEITIHGTISEYNGIVPVINVSQYQSQWMTNLPTYRYDANNGVVFRPWYDTAMSSSGDLITITDPVVRKDVIKIRSFACGWGENDSDECSVEWSDQFPSFISSYRHTFIHKDDVRYVFWDGVWYRIWASDEYYINHMSQYFDLMNTRLMADLVRAQLATKCVGPQTNVVEYISHTTREQNGNTFVIVRWLNSDKKLAICQLKLITNNYTLDFEGITTIPVEE